LLLPPGQLYRHGIRAQVGIGNEPRPYHGRVYLFGELPGLVERFGIPDPAWDGDYQAWSTWPAEAYIEVHLWSDEPIAGYLPPLATYRRPAQPLAGSGPAQTRARAMASA
jgi:hypothetical protein